mmetsp:Transcript_88764/g.253696  ORF Transcript_88764/g.253696 Transcript_88764/m.253696 type:complete len:229 (-) Transcript_88764:666-1352(-)
MSRPSGSSACPSMPAALPFICNAPTRTCASLASSTARSESCSTSSASVAASATSSNAPSRRSWWANLRRCNLRRFSNSSLFMAASASSCASNLLLASCACRRSSAGLMSALVSTSLPSASATDIAAFCPSSTSRACRSASSSRSSSSVANFASSSVAPTCRSCFASSRRFSFNFSDRFARFSAALTARLLITRCPASKVSFTRSSTGSSPAVASPLPLCATSSNCFSS